MGTTKTVATVDIYGLEQDRIYSSCQSSKPAPAAVIGSSLSRDGGSAPASFVQASAG
jgi:hypothetical protein